VRVCILLLSVDEAPMLRRSLPLAVAQVPGAEVVVVDNASTDATAALAAAHGARHLRIEPRRSYAAAMNAAIAATGGEAVLLLNADCFLAPGFVAAAAARLRDDPAVGAVAPKLVRVQREAALGDQPLALDDAVAIDTAGMTIDRRRKNGLVGHGAAISTFARAAPVFGADGAAALYRRSTLEDCALDGELLDEDMALWASDADLAWRAQLLGWRAVYEPAAVAGHVRSYSPSTRAQMSQAARRLQFRNRHLMILKNETAAGLVRDLPWIAGYEALALGHALLRERFLLTGYREIWQLRARARARRRLIQAKRRVQPPFGLRPPSVPGPR
jgi:GT2 family glycosyltransferase